MKRAKGLAHGIEEEDLPWWVEMKGFLPDLSREFVSIEAEISKVV